MTIDFYSKTWYKYNADYGRNIHDFTVGNIDPENKTKIKNAYKEYETAFTNANNEYSSKVKNREEIIDHDAYFIDASIKLSTLLKLMLVEADRYAKDNPTYYEIELSIKNFRKYLQRHKTGLKEKNNIKANIVFAIDVTSDLFGNYSVTENVENGYNSKYNKKLTCEGNCSVWSNSGYIKLDIDTYLNKPCFQISDEYYKKINDAYKEYQKEILEASRNQTLTNAYATSYGSFSSTFKDASSKLKTLLNLIIEALKQSNGNVLCGSEFDKMIDMIRSNSNHSIYDKDDDTVDVIGIPLYGFEVRIKNHIQSGGTFYKKYMKYKKKYLLYKNKL